MLGFLTNCRQVQEQQSRLLDGDLGLRDRILVRLHISLCKCCRRFGRQILLLRHFLRNQSDAENSSSPKLSEEARNRIAAQLEEEKP